MTKKTIIFDLDDTLGGLGESLCKSLNTFTGKGLSCEEWYKFDIISIYGMRIDDFNNVIINDKLLENMKPFAESKKLLTDLKQQGYTIKVITSRGYHPNARKITEDWLNKYEIPFDELIITEHSKKKCDYVTEEENVVLFLDDRVENCEDFIASGKATNVFLYSMPWNRYSPINKMKNLDEVRLLLNM